MLLIYINLQEIRWKYKVVKENVSKIKEEVILLGIFEEKKKLSGKALEIDTCTGGLIKKMIASGDFSGKFKQKKLLYTDKGSM